MFLYEFLKAAVVASTRSHPEVMKSDTTTDHELLLGFLHKHRPKHEVCIRARHKGSRVQGGCGRAWDELTLSPDIHHPAAPWTSPRVKTSDQSKSISWNWDDCGKNSVYFTTRLLHVRQWKVLFLICTFLESGINIINKTLFNTFRIRLLKQSLQWDHTTHFTCAFHNLTYLFRILSAPNPAE